jgi:integrase
MAKLIKRTWTSRGPTGHRVRKLAHGYTVQVNGKQVRRVGWATREEAEKALAASLLQTEPQSKGRASGLTLAQAAERYLAAKARKRSLAKDRQILEHLKSVFDADTSLANITASRISEYKAQRLAATSARRKDASGEPSLLSAASINRPLALLRHLLRLAHEEWQVLASVPRVRLEKEPQGRIRWLEPDEEARLLAACAKSRNPELVKIVTVALETGLRKGELLGLTWDRVDLSRGVLRLEVTKSGKRREVPYAAVGLRCPGEPPRPP